jgi:uncharacterized integral membrane protein
MSEDPTRAMRRPAGPGLPRYGRVGPADPHADPATQPGMRIPAQHEYRREEPTTPPEGMAKPVPSSPGSSGHAVARSRTGGLWLGLTFSAVVLLVLLIFIMQNLATVQIRFLWLTGSLPIGVALLLAAVAGLLLVAIPGGLRIMQLRRAARRR